MHSYVLDLRELDRTQVALAGGKGAHLGELSRLAGIRVPAGFCVTTDAFRRVSGDALKEPLKRLSRLQPDDREAIRELCAQIRRCVEGLRLPPQLAVAIIGRLAQGAAYAVRSSATAEDLPTASFAGQHDSYLKVVGPAAILEHVRRCWASLFTERAVAYRLRQGLDHRTVHMAVVVQRMAGAQAAGVLFTADPLTSNRQVSCVEAVFGLGEALVSGRVKADVYRVREGQVVTREVRQEKPVLTAAQVVRLAQLGRRIEAHFGCPQDIEWCRADDEFSIVQSRPITTLFPIPAADDEENRVYLSVAHQQMMTDAMKPLGLSVWQLTALRPMTHAGGRLFVDITGELATPTGRARLLAMGRLDPLTGDALETIVLRGFVPLLPDEATAGPPPPSAPAPIETDPAVVTGLIEQWQASLAAAQAAIRGKSGGALLDFIRADLQELKRLLSEPQSMRAIMAGMEATWWLNDQLQAWLGERNAADTLTQSVPHNVTSEMGLALLEVADVFRAHPDAVAALEQVENDGFVDQLPGPAREALQAFLARYGMRCAGEIDITRPRWSERPTTLVPLILGNLKNFGPGEGERRFEQGRRAAGEKKRELLERLRGLPDGERKAAETRRMIERVRTFSGYREYPKYGLVCRYFVYKQALLEEAARLPLRSREDIFYLTFQELDQVVRTHQVDDQLIQQRQAEFRSYQALTPPRVLTSEGECIAGAYRRDDVPEGALVGLPVSAGTVEGRARVILDMAEAALETGDILVTAYTDPSWTPVFVSLRGLVTEVGGLMTHGAVIAREYGLPAVVGVEGATRLIRDGQRIRVHGTDGYVEML